MDAPKKWTSDAAAQALVLAAEYFSDARLVSNARGGVAKKHRHRIHLALFGQMMAALEFLFKDFVASVVDLVPTFDEALAQAKWLETDAKRVLAFRSAPSTAGALLLHATQGWHDGETVNKRYSALFQRCPVESAEISALDRLWLLRHSVAHNAGFVTAYDAVRGGMPALAEAVADIDGEFVRGTFEFLCPVARRVADVVGGAVVTTWLKTRLTAGRNYERDRDTYQKLKLLASFVASRTEDLPKFTKVHYTVDCTLAT